MASLAQAVLQVFAFLRAFGVLEDGVMRARRVGFAISVDYFDINNAVCPSLPEATNADVASVAVGKCGVRRVGVWVGGGCWCGLVCVVGGVVGGGVGVGLRVCVGVGLGVTGSGSRNRVNTWFIANARGAQGFGT